MSAERRPRCRACNSQHREEIERRLLSGEPGRKVSAWLDQTHGEYISHAGLNAHKADHIQLAAEVRAEVEAQAERAKAAGVRRRVADIEMLDAVARQALRTSRLLAPKMEAPSMAQSTAYAAVLREVRECVKLRDDMLRDKKPAEGQAVAEAKLVVELSFPERPPPETPATPPPAEPAS